MTDKEATELLKDIKKVISAEMVVDLKAIYKKEEHTHLIKDVYVQALEKAIVSLDLQEMFVTRYKQSIQKLEKANKRCVGISVFCFIMGLLNLLCIFGVI